MTDMDKSVVLFILYLCMAAMDKSDVVVYSLLEIVYFWVEHLLRIGFLSTGWSLEGNKK